MEIMKKDSQKK